MVIPGLPFRWYGVMYLAAFVTTYLLVLRLVKKENIAKGSDEVVNLFFWVVLGLLVGGRLFAVIFYSPGGLYFRKPWLIFWPFQDGRFVGIQGMSYHGGLLGCIMGGLIYLRIKKSPILGWADKFAVAGPLGYTFGRLGNFINAELYGRVTASKIGMLFPNAPTLPVSETWVRDIASTLDIPIAQGDTAVNLPRHPSQLYEAFFEGIFLWAVLWFVIYRWKPFKGAVLASYLMGYGLVRFVIEYFRQPDEGIGFVVRLSPVNNPIELFLTPFNFSLGQVFCFLMIVIGAGLWVFWQNMHKKESLVIKHSA